MEYCCHVWDGAPGCYLEMLDKLQKRIFRAVRPLFADSLEPLGHCRNVPSLRLPIGITLVDVRLNWLNWFHFLILVENLLVILRLHDISVTIRRCYTYFHVNSFIPRTTRLWNSLPIKCFPLSYDLNGFKSVQPCTLDLTDTFYL